jgi:glutaminyl-tRNA synthetase
LFDELSSITKSFIHYAHQSDLSFVFCAGNSSNPRFTPKVDNMSKNHNAAEFVPLFKTMGLSDSKAAEAAKSPKSASILKELIESNSSISQGVEEKQASLIVALASSLSKAGVVGTEERTYIVVKILDGSLKSVDQVAGARPLEYYVGFACLTMPLSTAQLLSNTRNRTLHLSTMLNLTRSVVSVCYSHSKPNTHRLIHDLGFSIEPAQIVAHVKTYLTSNPSVTSWANLGATISGVKSAAEVRWASPVEIKNAVEKVFLETFGPKQAVQPKSKVGFSPERAAVEN